MATYFLDSSAVIKRYVNEVGTGWVSGLIDPAAGHRIYVARVTGVEVVAAITRRSRGGSLSPADAAAALAQFRVELANLFRVVEITPSLLNRAMTLAERHAIRGYDAVQLGAALHLNARRTARGQSPLAFVSADVELNAAAGVEGLLPDDPNSHP